MTPYQTAVLKNLNTGKSFTCMVKEEELENHIKSLEWHTTNYPSCGMARDPKSVILEFEFSLFPSYRQVLKVWIHVSDTDIAELVTRIVLDFGCSEEFLEKVLLDPTFIGQAQRILTGIACDGGRAVLAMKVIYDLVASHYSRDEHRQDLFLDM